MNWFQGNDLIAAIDAQEKQALVPERPPIEQRAFWAAERIRRRSAYAAYRDIAIYWLDADVGDFEIPDTMVDALTERHLVVLPKAIYVIVRELST